MQDNLNEKKTLKIEEKDSSSENDNLTLMSKEVFDINAITPGTEFMVRLDYFIQELIKFKMSNDEQ